MKKNGKVRGDCSLIKVNQLFRIMKLSFILLFVSFVSISASVSGQDDMITYSGRAVKVSEVLDYIEQNTDFTIAYSSEYIDLNREVSVNVKNEKVENLLDEVFQGTSIAIRVTENRILLFNKEVQQQEGVTKSISGVISDDKGEVIPGASVLIKGTTIGTITDLDGKFVLSDVPEDAVLVVSFIGMQSQEIAVAGKTVFNISLKSDVIGLDEVVAVGYGSKKKANLTGAVGNVQMNDMESRPLTNASLALQGTVAGVYALQSSGKPGDDNAVIDIRGVGTFGDNSPLILIDGFPGSMSDVNSNDIKSISVLKDAASASIYGNRAANGVILITTKKGAPGQMKVSYSGYIGVQEPTTLPDVLNSSEYVTLHREASENSGRVQTYSLEDLAKYEAGDDPMYPNIDYFDVYYGSASTQNHRLTMSGGTEKLHYAFMVGRLDQDGIMVATNYKKTDFRSNIDAYFLNDNRLRLSSKLSGNLGVKGEPRSVWNATWYATLAPIYPLKNADGQYMTVNGELNPYASIKAGSTSETKRYNFNGQVEAEYKILDGLSAQLTYGYNVVDANRNSFNANNVLYNKDGSTKTESSDLTVANDNNIQTLLTALIKYNKTIGLHQINMLAGYSEEEFTWDWQSGYRKNFVNNDQRVLSLGDAATQTNDAGSYDLGLKSYFGRVNYIFNDKYLFEANIRRDASSRFAEGNQWGTFPSFSGGWIISRESFMSNIDWLRALKLRGSWGQLGSQNIGSYYNGSDVLSSGRNYSLGGTLYSGVAITSMTNKELTWETSEQLNFGVDLTLDNGIDFTFDFFDKRTKDLLLTRPIPLTMAASAPYVNAGEVQNKGFEASLTYRKTFSNGLKLRTTLNASHIVNKITKMNAPEQLNSPKAIKVGYAINSFYGYEMDGIYQVSDFDYDGTTYTLKPDVVSVTNYVAQPGDIKFKDLNGDNVVDANNDRKVIGKQFPDLTYSMNINLEWKNFDLGMFFQGVQGIEGYLYYEIASPFSGVANMGTWWKDRWTPDRPSNTLPRLTLDEYRTNIHSSFYMEDASYLRLKNLELGYTLSPGIISKIGLSSVRVYGNIQNVFTITDFKGFDPEQTVDQTRAEAFPQVRVMTMGINVNF
ncbi:TonB-dependent receptor [Plebeiibacterium marinum]|uniref:TonB-dependent receptor n=1 Tax=Plebeiibacterium marinum TaxID=2992111 RepID=A0AAE3MBI4_9BACT|nr:TonB-dependent receptor [Plebeiobacterium marinum]MCW3804746.1 TonB-dependent receptor [Plebeiobacterium marinum]